MSCDGSSRDQPGMIFLFSISTCNSQNLGATDYLCESVSGVVLAETDFIMSDFPHYSVVLGPGDGFFE